MQYTKVISLLTTLILAMVIANIANATPNASSQWRQVGSDLGSWRPEQGAMSFNKAGSPVVAFVDNGATQSDPEPADMGVPIQLNRAFIYKLHHGKWQQVGGRLGTHFVASSFIRLAANNAMYVAINDHAVSGNEKSAASIFHRNLFWWSNLGDLKIKYLLDINDMAVNKNIGVFVLTTQIFSSRDDYEKVIVYKKSWFQWSQVGVVLQDTKSRICGQNIKIGNNRVYLTVLTKANTDLSEDGDQIAIGIPKVLQLDNNKWVAVGKPLIEQPSTAVFPAISNAGTLYAAIKTVTKKGSADGKVIVYKFSKNGWQQLSATFIESNNITFGNPQIATDSKDNLYLAFTKINNKTDKAAIYVYRYNRASSTWQQIGTSLGSQKSKFLALDINKRDTPYVMIVNAYNGGYNPGLGKIKIFKLIKAYK